MNYRHFILSRIYLKKGWAEGSVIFLTQNNLMQNRKGWYEQALKGFFPDIYREWVAKYLETHTDLLDILEEELKRKIRAGWTE